ncbi:MAG: MFS transporter [Acidobacteria bacterium]|nr:MAG: MFS transporter [Acidobacteriota bacterium]
MADHASVGKNPTKRRALKFVLLIGVVSFFADFTYEGARSVTGPYLAILGASATLVGFIAGLGELLGYGLRLVSGRLSERTGEFWPITLFGYVVQMSAVPLLALAPNWRIAGLLIVVERIGKAIRNPPRDVMLSHAAKQIGYGWGFGLHEALDQFGALFGPLVVAAVLAARGNYKTAFAILLVPAIVTLLLLVFARFSYPKPEDLEVSVSNVEASGLPPVFWIYLVGAGLVAAGFADFSLMAYHFEKASVIPNIWVPVFYSVAMGVSGIGSLLFGHLFDRVGIWILVPLTLIAASSAPLVFLGGFWLALIGSALWGLGMGVHESIIPAAVASMVPQQRRPSAYGIFTAGYGVCWFIGSVIIGRLYDVSVFALIVFSVLAQMVAIPIFVNVNKRLRTSFN